MSAFSPFFEEPRPAEPLWSVDGYRIVRCKDSGLVYVANPLSDEELERFYSVEYFEGDAARKGYASYEDDEEILRKNFRRSLAAIMRDVGAGREKLLADYGCAYGYFLDEARPYFRQVIGLELNESVAAIGRERFELDIRSGADAIRGIPAADLITMWDVIEHLNRPRAALEACREALVPGGRLYISTGDIDSPLARALGRRWRLVNPPQHVTYFSRDTLTRLLDRAGFEVEAVEYPGKHVSVGFFLFIARYLLRRPSLGRALERLGEKSVYVNLRDVMMIRARRR